jgi:hypothetical protein
VSGSGGGGSRANEGYLMATRVFSVVIVAFGLIILGVTLANGGGPASTGFVLGVLFVALGAGRLYLALRDR